MRLRIQHPLFVGFLGVIGLLVLLIVPLVGTGLRRELGTSVRSELERLLALTDAIVAGSPDRDPHQLARSISERIGYRITFIDHDGTVIADSSVEPGDVPAVENHADRPEVRGAIAGRPRASFSERTSPTVGVTMLYGARRGTLSGRPVVVRIAAPRADVEAAVGRIQGTVAVAGLVAMLLSLVAAYALSLVLARPLVAMADRARRLTAGDFTSTVPHARVAELEDLSVAFNRLTEELRGRLSELSAERDGMQALIDTMAEGVVALDQEGRILRMNRTARALLDLPDDERSAPVASKVRQPALRDALRESVASPELSREIVLNSRHLLLASRALDRGGAVTTFLDITELRRMERVRSDFVANASHELKTPLTSIRGYAEALGEEPPEEMRQRFLGSILSSTLRLQRLVDDLLDLSRLESGGWSAKIEPVQVAETIMEAWDLVAPAAASAVSFELRGVGAVLGDRQGLVQVFRNLLENAVRHTPAGGHVTVMVTDSVNDAVEISVADDGEGIPTEALPRIFERFYRVDSSRMRQVGGTGLGLALVKHLVSAMGGDVGAESALGQGTTIWIRLPATQGRPS